MNVKIIQENAYEKICDYALMLLCGTRARVRACVCVKKFIYILNF